MKVGHGWTSYLLVLGLVEVLAVSCSSDNGPSDTPSSDGTIISDGAIISDVCDPNPCTQSFQTVCSAVNGQAICSCDQRYEEVAGSCVASVNAMEGTVEGTSLQPSQAIAVTAPSGGESTDEFLILLSEAVIDCQNPPSSLPGVGLLLKLADEPIPGVVYNVVPPAAKSPTEVDVGGFFQKADENGEEIFEHEANSGSIVLDTVEKIAGGYTRGRFNLVFLNGQSVSGTFKALWCPALGG